MGVLLQPVRAQMADSDAFIFNRIAAKSIRYLLELRYCLEQE